MEACDRGLSKPKDGAIFHPAGFLLSILGAILLLWIVGMMNHTA